MPAPVIASIASPLIFVIETAINFTVGITGATKVEVEADWEGFYYNWDIATNLLHFEGTPKELVAGKAFTIKATAADAATTTLNGTYNVVTPAPIITDVTGTLKFPKGKKPHLFIPIANTPVQGNVKGQLIGADYALEDAGIRIKGDAIPADANFTITSGHFDIEARNTGGVDTQNNVPFDILTNAPQLSGLSFNFSTRTFSWTKATDARSYAWRIGLTGDWTDVGDVSSHTFAAAPAAESTIYVRVNQPWIGDAVSVAGGVVPTISSIGNFARVVGYNNYQFQPVVTGSSPITWSITGSNATISSSGTVTLASGLSAGTYTYTVTATNALGSDTEMFSVKVGNNAPVVVLIDNISKSAGYTSFSFYVPALHGVSGGVWSITGSNATVDSSGTVTIASGLSAGTYTYAMTLTNALGSDTESFTLTVS